MKEIDHDPIAEAKATPLEKIQILKGKDLKAALNAAMGIKKKSQKVRTKTK